MHFEHSDLDESTTSFLKSVVKRLDQDIELAIAAANVPRGAVRSTGPCLVHVLINSTDVYVIGKKTDLVSTTYYNSITEGRHTANEVHSFAILQMGLDDPFVLQIQRSQIEHDHLVVCSDFNLTHLAADYVKNEVSYRQRLKGLKGSDVLLGSDSIQVQENRCFVMMPFDSALKGIYDHHIKKVVTSKGFECKRADDYHGPRVITSDIGLLIRGSKLLIADLTLAKPNVFYELGIAHTVGKSPILICQSGTKLEFDIQHYRIHTYDNNAEGLARLDDLLAKAIDEILGPQLS